jgi:SAM-dependent methyltransferase
MPAALDFTGERFIPGAAGEIAYEHCHRYAFARRFVAGSRVLDAACGEGYGTALLGAIAADATGVDIDAAAVAHAGTAYGGRGKVRYVCASVTALPFAAAAFDAVVSFETIEHLAAADQPRMLAEFARVLAPGGLLVLSSPNRRRYSDERGFRNPFHRHELYRDELARLLDPEFPHRRWFHQQPAYASTIWGEADAAATDACEAWSGGIDGVVPAVATAGLYYIVVAAVTAAALPPAGPRVSLFADRDDSEYRRAQWNAAEVLRQDRLLKDRDAALDRQTAHVAHLEALVDERERVVEERDAQLVAVNAARESFEHSLAAAQEASRQAQGESGRILAQREAELAKARTTVASLQAEGKRLEAALLAQERIIAYQQSLRGWLHAPWRQLKRAWQRGSGG